MRFEAILPSSSSSIFIEAGSVLTISSNASSDGRSMLRTAMVTSCADMMTSCAGLSSISCLMWTPGLLSGGEDWVTSRGVTVSSKVGLMASRGFLETTDLVVSGGVKGTSRVFASLKGGLRRQDTG